MLLPKPKHDLAKQLVPLLAMADAPRTSLKEILSAVQNCAVDVKYTAALVIFNNKQSLAIG